MSLLLLMNMSIAVDSQSQSFIPVNAQDSLVIVEFQEALRAEGWPDFWDATGPARTWNGISWTGGSDGRVSTVMITGTDATFQTDSLPKSIELLSQLSQLQNLILLDLGLKVIPAEIGQLTQVNALNLGDNQIRALPIEINDMANLSFLALFENEFDAVPDLSGLANLAILNMNQNPRLTSLNVPIMGSLESLDVSFCPITNISDDIQNLTNLQVLNLDQCSLSTLPNTIDQLTQLTILRMLRNNFVTLPPAIGNLQALEFLDISFNQLSSLPVEFQQLNTLAEIRFDHNNFTSFPPSIVGLPALVRILANDNQIAGSIPTNLFSNPNMVVDLSVNRLTGQVPLGPGGEVPIFLNIEDNAFQLKDVITIYPVLTGAGGNLRFNPQQLIGTRRIIIPESGEDITIRVDDYTPLANAVIRWYRIPNLNSNVPPAFVLEGEEVLLQNFNPLTDGGIYFCTVTHPDLPGLELQSNQIKVIGTNQSPDFFASDLKFRKNDIPTLIVNASDDFTNSSDLIVNVQNTTNLSFSELPFTNVARREIILNDPSWTGTDTVLITVIDEQGNQTSKSITITVLEANNNPPTFSPVPPIYLSFDGSFPNGSTGSCPTTWLYSTTTNIEQFVADDLDETIDLIFALDPADTVGFQQNNLLLSVNNFSQPKRIEAFVFACQDTTFSVTFDLEVSDSEGAMSSQEITLQYDPLNTPPQIAAIPEQFILKGTPSFQSIDLADFVTDDFLSINQLNWNIIDQGSIDLTFEDQGSTVLLNASPIFSDSAYTDTVTVLVSEATNDQIFNIFTIIYTVVDQGIFISGTITDNNAPLEGVSLGGFPFEVITNVNGEYSGEVPPNWSGEITPSLAAYTFDPTSLSFTNLQSDSAGNDFEATFIGTYTVSGFTRDSFDNPLSGVELSGFLSAVVSDDAGFYEADVPAGWSGIITPQLEDYVFDPVSITIANLQSDSTNNNFVGTFVGTYTVSGTVRDQSGAGLENVQLEGLPVSTLTDAQGFYEADVPAGWSGVITPRLEDYAFNPESITITNLQSDSTNNDFIGTFIGTYTISGNIFDGAGARLANVQLNGFPEVTTTDAEGFYEAEVPAGWSGVITPELVQYTFSPSSRSFEAVNSDFLDQNFNATLITEFTISGRIVDENNEPLANVILNGVPGSDVFTDGDGFYSVIVPVDWSGTITPVLDTYFFEPTFLTYESVIQDIPDQNYLAFLITGLSEEYGQLFTVYPNPSNGPVQVSFNTDLTKNAVLTIISNDGRIIENYEVSEGTQSLKWDASDTSGNRYKSGVYYFKLTDEGGVIGLARVLLLE